MPSHHTLFRKAIITAALALAASPVAAGPDEGEQAELPAEKEEAPAPSPATPGITAPLLPAPEATIPPVPEKAEASPPETTTPRRAPSGTTSSASGKRAKRWPTSPRCADKRTWYCGVSTAAQAHALKLYEQGNQFFDDNLFPAAVTRYREALVHWSHPGIQYNLMLALVALDQPIEAFQASMEALRYGVQALKLEEYRRAVDYQRLLRGQIASLEVTCDEPGAVVSLDGKEILQGPGTVHLFVRPGQHELVARKDGYLSTHHTIVTVSETPVSLDMRLLPQTKATVPVRRWPAWQPWAVVGAGVGVGVMGGVLEWRANVNNRSFEELFKSHCEPMKQHGCHPGQYTRSMEARWTRYTWYRRMSHGASVAGGITMLGGFLFLYLNREQRMDNPERHNLVRVSATPSLTADTIGLTLEGSF